MASRRTPRTVPVLPLAVGSAMRILGPRDARLGANGAAVAKRSGGHAAAHAAATQRQAALPLGVDQLPRAHPAGRARAAAGVPHCARLLAWTHERGHAR